MIWDRISPPLPPSWPGMGYPYSNPHSCLAVPTHPDLGPDLDRGLPHPAPFPPSWPGMGYPVPCPDLGPGLDWVTLPYPQSWPGMGYPHPCPHPDLGQGTPACHPDLGPDLDGGGYPTLPLCPDLGPDQGMGGLPTLPLPPSWSGIEYSYLTPQTCLALPTILTWDLTWTGGTPCHPSPPSWPGMGYPSHSPKCEWTCPICSS